MLLPRHRVALCAFVWCTLLGSPAVMAQEVAGREVRWWQVYTSAHVVSTTAGGACAISAKVQYKRRARQPKRYVFSTNRGPVYSYKGAYSTSLVVCAALVVPELATTTLLATWIKDLVSGASREQSEEARAELIRHYISQHREVLLDELALGGGAHVSVLHILFGHEPDSSEAVRDWTRAGRRALSPHLLSDSIDAPTALALLRMLGAS